MVDMSLSMSKNSHVKNSQIMSKNDNIISDMNNTSNIDHKIKYIGKSTWFQTMEHYPQTISQLSLLVSIVDKAGIFKKYDLALTKNMDGRQLNILYAILRIANNIYNTYSEHSVKKIVDRLKIVFKSDIEPNNYFDRLIDQLMQDIDHFICITIKNHFYKMEKINLKKDFIRYFQLTLQRTFYTDCLKKINVTINSHFFETHLKLFTNITKEFISYTNENLFEPYNVLEQWLDKIFSPHCTQTCIKEVTHSIQKSINISDLLTESCMEIDIYSEVKLDEELENSESPTIEILAIAETTKITKTTKILKTSDLEHNHRPEKILRPDAIYI